MSYLNHAEDWERLQAADPFLAGMIMSAPRSLFVPPPGVDARQAYASAFSLFISVWMHIGLLCAALSPPA